MWLFLGSLPAINSCLADIHVSLESCLHVPEPLWVLTTKGTRKRPKKGGGAGRRKGYKEIGGKNVCWLSQIGGFLSRLSIGSSVPSVCLSLFEKRLELTHTQHPPSMEISMGWESSHTSKSIHSLYTEFCRAIIPYGPTHTHQLYTD